MTIEEMKKKKQEKGYSYAMMSDLSGVPVGTIQKIFSGETTSPRYDTLRALEKLFTPVSVLREADSYEAHTQGSYTVDDYRALPDERRVELIDGYFYDMAAPTFTHQSIGGEIYRQIANFIMDRGGSCRPFIAPVDVQLDCDERTIVQPDVGIICHEERIQHFGVYGAPDFLVEVLSPSTRRKDSIKKLDKYLEAGVREYWILDPYQKRLLVYFFESEVYPKIYGLDQQVPINIYDGALSIDFSNILKWIEEDERHT